MKPSYRQSLYRLLEKNRETLACMERALSMRDWNELETMGAGVLLSDIYQGTEQILVFVLEKIHGTRIPKNESWHDALLTLSKEMSLYPQEVYPVLRGMLRYRHVQRHGYGVDLDAEKIRHNAPEAVTAYRLFEKHVLEKYPELVETAPGIPE